MTDETFARHPTAPTAAKPGPGTASAANSAGRELPLLLPPPALSAGPQSRGFRSKAPRDQPNAASRAPPRDQSQPQALGSRPGNPHFNKPQWDSDASPGLGAPPLLTGQDRHLSWLMMGRAVFGRGCFGKAQPLAWSCSSLQCRAWWWALMPLGTS